MIIEYCDKCTIRIQGPPVVDPATNARYCAKCAAEMPQLGKTKSVRRESGRGLIPEPAGSPPPRPKPSPKPEPNNSGQMKIIGAAFAAVLLIMVFLLSRDSNLPPVQDPAKTTGTSSLSGTTPKITDTTTPAPTNPGPSQAELSLRDRNEQLAREMYNQIKAQLAANPAQKQQAIIKLNELSEKYDGTIAAEDAQSLASRLKPGDSVAKSDPKHSSTAVKPEPGNWVEITTKSGQFGNSGYIRWYDGPSSFGGGILLIKNTGAQSDLTRKLYIRFDLSSIDFNPTDACIKLFVNTPAEKDQKLVLYGITDETLDDTPLSKEITWSNAPANDPNSPFEANKTKATSLVTLTTKKANSPVGHGLDFRSQGLLDFINRKKNKKVTFILGRETKAGTNLVFSGDSSESPPMLRLKK